MKEVTSATVREADDEWHIECQFNDGQKYVAIKVDIDCEQLAEVISAFLNSQEFQKLQSDRYFAWLEGNERRPKYR